MDDVLAVDVSEGRRRLEPVELALLIRELPGLKKTHSNGFFHLLSGFRSWIFMDSPSSNAWFEPPGPSEVGEEFAPADALHDDVHEVLILWSACGEIGRFSSKAGQNRLKTTQKRPWTT